jgi:ArsR family transcriptional regulator, arsenate/arsenite/antimonite-responsive transcriptional repressor
MNDLVLFAKALADPTRLRLLAALRVGRELCVCELCDALEMRQSTLSSHLEVIRQAGMLTTRKDGKWTYYGVEPSHATLLEAAFARYADALRADERLRRDAEGVERRLALRDENGCCVLGFGQLDAAPQAVKP